MKEQKLREILWLREFLTGKEKIKEQALRDNKLPDYAGYNLRFWNKIYKQGREEVSNIVCNAIFDVLLYIYSDKLKKNCDNCQKRGRCEHRPCIWTPDFNLFLDLFKENLEDKESFDRRMQNE